MALSEILAYENNFDRETNEFIPEGKGRHYIKDSKLYLDDSEHRKGFTLWLNKTFTGDIHIQYEAMVVEPDLQGNVNLFFMASTLNDEAVLKEEHSGGYEEYHKTCKMYITTFVGQPKNPADTGGHYSRFRKDPGFLLLSENTTVTTKLNELYLIDVYKIGSMLEYRINGCTIHKIFDNDPYDHGSIGFRTWSTHMWVDNFKVYNIIS